MYKKILFLLLLLSSQNVIAETKKYFNDFKYSGYLDTSYNYLLRKDKFTSGVLNRVYDIEQNGFTLHQLGVTLSDQPTQGFGGLLDVFIGRDAIILAAYGFNPDFGLSKNIGIYTPQAFLQYATSSWTFYGGQILSLAGYEVDNSSQDTNFSRSIVSGFLQPGSVLGLRATYTLNDQVNFSFGINNGWDNVSDTSRGKTLEANTNFKLNSIFSFSLAGYSGEERAAENTSSGPIGRRSLLDFIMTINVTDKATVVTNYDYMVQSKGSLPNGVIGKALVQGIAGYFNYQFSDKWHTSLRGEYFSDLNGFSTGVAQNWRELTLTVGYVPFKHFELRAETRHDFTSANSFVNTNGVSVSNNNQSFGLEALYQF